MLKILALSLFANLNILHALRGNIWMANKPHVCVVGGGWGGWGAAKSLCEMGCKVSLIDVLPDPTGETAYLTPTGKPFEAGTRGFWKDYPNIYDLVEKLGLKEDETFTPWTNSTFYSPFGLEATAPVFSSSSFPQLPSPLGQVVASARYFERIPVSDRATMAGLLYAILDFNRDEKTLEAYDRMTAHDLFIRMKISKRLVDDFIRPTLLVGLFKPPEELSAAVTLELLYYYALAHQTSFDVRWIKEKSIGEKIIAPLAKSLIEKYDITVIGGSRVESIVAKKSDGKIKIKEIQFSSKTLSSAKLDDIDACVLAVGANGLKKIMKGSPALARFSPELTLASSLNSIDVMAARIWLNKKVSGRSPVGVFSRFPALRGAGGTFFCLDELQGNTETLWGGETPQGSVFSCDFYNAGGLLSLSNEDIINTLMNDLLPTAFPEIRNAEVVDSHVVRFQNAVSWFSPGSYVKRPPLQVPGIDNLVCAGDWVKMGEYEHGAKGLCQERAYVSGIQAANALAKNGVLGNENKGKQANVIPIRDDEIQVKFGRRINKRVMERLKPFNLDSFWVR